MDALSLSLNAVFPIFFWMVLGYGARRLLDIRQDWRDKANTLIFYLFMPVLLFTNMAGSDLGKSLSAATGRVLIYVYAALAATFLALMFIVPRIVKDNPSRGSTVQAIFRSNTALFGLPTALALYPGADIGAIVIVIAAIVPLLNVLSVLCLERFCGERAALGKTIWKIVTNPLIIGVVAGVLVNVSGLPIPQVLQKSLTGLANVATPLAFLVLGMGLSFSSMSAGRRALLAIAFCKLILVPAVWISAGLLLGFRGQALTAILVVFGPPTAVNSYTMACTMGGNPQLSGEAIAVTSIASIATMFAWISLLQYAAVL